MKARGTPCIATHRDQSPRPISIPPRRATATMRARDKETISVSLALTSPYGDAAESARRNRMASNRTAEFVRRLAEPDPAVLAQLVDPDEFTSRILRATLEQAKLVGIRRTTMEDVARRSGVGRATLYRRFPTKAVLIDAVVLAEARRFMEGSALAHAQADTIEDSLVYGTVFTVTFLREHSLLRKLLR